MKALRYSSGGSVKILIFGPSCGGKSTLSKSLHESFGKEWSYLDRDDLVEQGHATDETVNELIEKKLREFKGHLILDIQVPWREKREDEIYILVFAPLSKLLERDLQRTLHLKRDETRAYYAKEFVIKTYGQLIDKGGKPKFSCDGVLDSSLMPMDKEIEHVQKWVQRFLTKRG